MEIFSTVLVGSEFHFRRVLNKRFFMKLINFQRISELQIRNVNSLILLNSVIAKISVISSFSALELQKHTAQIYDLILFRFFNARI